MLSIAKHVAQTGVNLYPITVQGQYRNAVIGIVKNFFEGIVRIWEAIWREEGIHASIV